MTEPSASSGDLPTPSTGSSSPPTTSISGAATVEDLIAKLDALGPDGVSYTGSMLRASYRSQRVLVKWLGGLGDRQEVGLAEVDAALLRWLHACYLYVSSVPGLSSGTVPLAPVLAFSGLLRPFVAAAAGGPSGALAVGLPSNEDAVADNLSELVRTAGAALVTYHQYLTQPSREGSVPSDDASLLLASLTIKSCQAEGAAERLDTEAAAAAAVELRTPGDDAEGDMASASGAQLPEHARLESFGVSGIRWLMHWLRAELSTHFGNVRFLLGDRVGHKGSLVAAQQDKLCLLKLAPGNLVAYVLYCRACLAFQQMKAAHVFATKGLVVADALRDDAHRAQLLLVRATAAVLGGGGPTWRAGEARRALSDAQSARQHCTGWMPEKFYALVDLEPEQRIVTEVLQQAAAGADDDADVPVLDLLYALPEPSSLPPGAVQQSAGDGGGAEGPGSDAGVPGGGAAKPDVGQHGAKPAAQGQGRHRATAKRK